MKVATPRGYEPKEKVAGVEFSNNPKAAAKGADILYTDVWVSMGKERESRKREKAFEGFQLNDSLVSMAKKGVKIMHCLPAHRGEEITDSVIDSKSSVVYDQAENRMHVEKAILLKLLA